MPTYIFRERIERRTTLEGETLHYVVRTGRRPWLKVFSQEDVPPFEGKEAWFEVEKRPGKPWRFLRQIDP